MSKNEDEKECGHMSKKNASRVKALMKKKGKKK